jgi:hypothetical protein
MGVTALIMSNVTIAYCSEDYDRCLCLRADSRQRPALNLNFKQKEEVMKRQFFIAGVQFRPRAEINQAAKEMQVGDLLTLEVEPTNKFDPNAVKIMLRYEESVSDTEEKYVDIFLGYVPKKFSSEVAAMLSIGAPIQCTVDEVNPQAKTYEMFKVTISIPIEEEEDSAHLDDADYIDGDQ